MRRKGGLFKINEELVAKRIKKLRQKHDLKQYEIADAIKRTRASYGGCENGSFRTGLDMVLSLREFYKGYGENLSIDYLLGFTDNPEGNVNQSSQIETLQGTIKVLQATVKEKQDLIEETQKDLIRMLKDQKR